MFLFSQAGRPDLTQKWVDWAATKFYATGRAGIAGNEDAGTLSAWYVLSALGLYAMPASDVWLLGRPQFPRVDLAVAGGTLTILAPNAAPGWIYVKSVTLDGAPVDHPWLHHVQLAAGGVLAFEMSDQPTSWGTDFGTP
jgi:putative alpha-1,2-mannosidase